MLKLEKLRRSDPVAIRLREKEKLFTRAFTIALAIALAFHLSLFVVFKIQPFNSGSSFLFPPVQVESALPNSSHTTLQVYNHQDKEDFELFLQDHPVFPKQQEDLFRVQLEHSRPLTIPASFRVLEERFIPIRSSPMMGKTQQFQFFISGPLAGRQLISKADLPSLPINGKKLSQAEAFYQVQIDPETGTLFWYEIIQATGRKEIDALFEQFLKTLRFSAEPLLEHLKGEVHFIMMVDD